MELLGTLGNVIVQPGAKDKRIFDLTGGQDTKALGKEYLGLLESLSKGEYDSLFETTTEKPSTLYRLAQIPISRPSVELSSSSPFRPEVYVEPEYPPIARMAHIQGEVAVNFDVDWASKAGKIEVEKGQSMLVESVKRAVSGWVFSPQAANSHVQAVFNFSNNCADPTEK
jgi:TonB family protein